MELDGEVALEVHSRARKRGKTRGLTVIPFLASAAKKGRRSDRIDGGGFRLPEKEEDVDARLQGLWCSGLLTVRSFLPRRS